MSNSNLKIYVADFFDNLEMYDDFTNGHYYNDLLRAVIFAFLDNENEYNAYEVYETFFMIYQITSEDKSEGLKNKSFVADEPNTLLDLVKIMGKYEEKTGDLIEKQRDHFIHSVNVFILGLAVYSQNRKYRARFREYILSSNYDKYYKKYYKTENKEFSHEEFLYRWGIASLFHDIGYPVEIIGKQLTQFIKNGVKSISPSYIVDTAIDFKDFNEFNSIIRMKSNFADDFRENHPDAKFLDLFKPTDIMAYKITTDFPEIDINELIKHLNSFVDIMGDNGFIDHGFFSSILVLNSYGYLIQKYSRDFSFFFYPIVDSATAILLHNYYNNVLRKEPFSLEQLHPNRNPLAFLLILCDELQEWNRKPMGVKDKQKSHVNELNIRIDNDVLGLKYIVKSGAMGLGFSKQKEDFLNDVLSLRPSLFTYGLSINTEVSYEGVIKDMEEMEKEEVASPGILLRNIEQLAIKIHKDYYENLDEEGKKKTKKDFDQLEPEFKMSNIRQAKSIATKLNLIGCEIAPDDDKRDKYELSNDEIIALAIYEHEEWCNEKERNGWTYNEIRNDDIKHHDCLIKWDDERLTPAQKDKDINTIKNIPYLLESIGCKIVMSRLRLLTIEKHNSYKEIMADADEFEDLPYYIKFIDYRQTDVLIKSLAELGYSLVSDKDPDSKLIVFNDDEIEYLARRDHKEWYTIKLNLGWKYGPVKNEDAKTSPNLVKWDDLHPDVKHLNLRTFEKLPKLCKNAGLRIVKN